MIGPVNIRVAPDAGSAQHASIRQVRKCLGRMKRSVVTLLTESWGAYFEHVNVVASVCVMACHAVLPNGRVLPQKRASLLRMAAVTGLVGTVALDQGVGDRAMRIVATGTLHLPFPDGHMGEALECRHLHRMTLATQFHLGRCLQLRPA